MLLSTELKMLVSSLGGYIIQSNQMYGESKLNYFDICLMKIDTSKRNHCIRQRVNPIKDGSFQKYADLYFHLVESICMTKLCKVRTSEFVFLQAKAECGTAWLRNESGRYQISVTVLECKRGGKYTKNREIL